MEINQISPIKSILSIIMGGNFWQLCQYNVTPFGQTSD